MGIKAVVFENFGGNWSADPKLGIKGSAQYIQGFDTRSNPSQMTMGPALIQEDENVIVDLITDMVEVPFLAGSTSYKYAFGNAGYLYERTPGSVHWSNEGKFPTSGQSMDYRADSYTIFLTGSTTVHAYGPVNSPQALASPTASPNQYAASFSTYNNSAVAGFNVSAYQSGSALVSALATIISELATALRYFQSDIEPLSKISVYVVTKGTGDWTLTLHDGLNNALATATVTNANLNANDWNDFAFTNTSFSQVRIYVAPNARTYHWHLTSSDGTGTIASSVTNDISTADTEIWADRLVATFESVHPIIRFQQFECIGNGNYLSIWEPISPMPTNAEWQRHKLVFPSEYTMTALTTQSEFLVMTLSNKKQSIVAYWDGLSPTYNFITQVPEGIVRGLSTYRNVVTYYAGGSWWSIPSVGSNPIKVRRMPNQLPNSSTPNDVPYAGGTNWNGMNLIAYNGSTYLGSKTAVYSWGALDKNFPESFGQEFATSLTNDSGIDDIESIQIGMAKSLDPKTVYVSWTDPPLFGLDTLDYNTSAPFAVWESLVMDNGYASRQQQGMYVDCYYDLPVGAVIQLKYRLDRGEWIFSDDFGPSNLWQGRLGYARLNVGDNTDGRYYEAEVGIEVTNATGSQIKPNIYSVSWVFDDLKLEALV